MLRKIGTFRINFNDIKYFRSNGENETYVHFLDNSYVIVKVSLETFDKEYEIFLAEKTQVFEIK